jgi:DNA topoisomerase VI subunit B
VAEHISRQRRAAESERKKSYIQRYIGHIAEALREITGDSDQKKEQVEEDLQAILERSRS